MGKPAMYDMEFINETKARQKRKFLEGTVGSTESMRKLKHNARCEEVVRKVIGHDKGFSKMSVWERLIAMGDAYDIMEVQTDDVFDAVNALMSAIEVFEARMTIYT